MKPLLHRRNFLRNSLLILAALPLQRALATVPFTFKLGIDTLAGDAYSTLRGQRVGLLTHPAGVNATGISTIRLLHRAKSVNLVALFGPEHGIRGNEKANEHVGHSTDRETLLPVFSLYGPTRRPTEEMLRGIDTMVVDLQDIGSRSYTFISTLRYTMEECFRAGVQVVVLDRPNPLGGELLDGPFMERDWMSFVGAWQIPYVHGCTIGELALMGAKQPGVLDLTDRERRRGRLTVIPMKGWKRSMKWPQTGLRWVPTSPAIPDVSAALGYTMTGLGTQIGPFSHGYGTRYPFRLIQFRGRSPEAIAAALSRRRIPGMAFPIVSFQHRGQARRGVYTKVTDWQRFQPSLLSLHLMQLTTEWSEPNPFATANTQQRNLFLKHFGDSAVLQQLVENPQALDIAAIHRNWDARNRKWANSIRKYLLYS